MEAKGRDNEGLDLNHAQKSKMTHISHIRKMLNLPAASNLALISTFLS